MADINDNIEKLYRALEKEGYDDIGTPDEFREFVSDSANVSKLHQSLSDAGYDDIGTEEEFGKWLNPEGTAKETAVPANETAGGEAAVTQQHTQQTAEPKEQEFPQPVDAEGNMLTHNGQPYSQEVLRRYYSQENKAGQFRDLATIAADLERDESVSKMHTTGGAGYAPSQNFTIAEPQQQQTGKTPDEQLADEQAAQHNDEFWSQDPTLQQRKEYNARNAFLLDPTIPRDQRSMFQKENRQNLIDVSNPRYASIIHHKEAVDEGMRVFDEAMKKAEEKGRQSVLNALRNTGGLESLAGAINPTGDIASNINAIRQGNDIADPQKVMDKVVQDVSDSLMKNEHFTKGGKLNDAGRYAIIDLRQRMVQQLVDARIPESTAEYVVLTAIKNSDIGKLTRMATNTAYENWLDDVAASRYDAGFWEKVFNGALTFGLNLPEYLGTGVAGGAVSKKIVGEFTKRTANELMKRGVQKATAERAAQMVINNSMAGTATKLGAVSAAGATTFGLQPIIGEPIDITYQTGQPGIIEGTINTPGLSDYFFKTVKEMGKNTAMGALMIGGAAAKTAEKIAEGAVKEGVVRGAAGLAYDSSVMAYFALQDMKEQMPDFEITPETAAEAFAESAASLALLKAPHIFGLRGKIKDAKEFNRKFNFTPEDKDVLKSMGIDNPLDLVEKLAYKGAAPETIKKGKGDVTLPSADGIQSINAEEMQQLTNQYRTFMASDAPETLKAKVQYLIEGKMPQQFSAPVESRVVERNGNVYLETINENGGVIESRKMKDLLSAEKERMQLNFDIDTNKTAAIERRLNEQEVVSDFANNLAQEYEEARIKSLSGEDLTAEERQAVYLYQNFDMLKTALERQAAGAELLPEQQALINAMIGRTKAYVNRDNASKQVAREVESQFGLQEGELDKIMNGHTKDEAMAIADETGEQVFEVGNGIYRSNSEFNIIERYREALLNRINDNIARKNAEDVAQAAEEAQIQDNTPRIESQPGTEETSDFGGENGGTPPPAASAGGTDGTTSGGSGTTSGPSGTITQGYSPITDGYSGITSPYQPADTQARRDAAYERGKAVAQDESQLVAIGQNNRLAEARMMQLLPYSDLNAARVRSIIIEAVESGDDETLDRILEKEMPRLSAQQREAVEQYLDAVETQYGIGDVVSEKAAAYAEQRREQLKVVSDPQGNVTPLKLNDGRTVYYKSGDLNNHYGGVTAVDENGKVEKIPVRSIAEVGQSAPMDAIIDSEIEQYAAQLEQQYNGIATGAILQPGRQVDMLMSGQGFTATVMGTDAAGNTIFQMEDGSQMTMRPEDAQKFIAAADDLKIQEQLKAEREAAVAQQQTERFTKSIKGFAEGQPDLTAAETSSKVAVEYIKSQLGADGSDPEKARKKYIADTKAGMERNKMRLNEIDKERDRIQQWLKGNEDIADPAEVEQMKQKASQLIHEMSEIEVRQIKSGDIYRNLMTPDELNQMEQERRREIFKAGSGYQPQLPQRNVRMGEDRITLEDNQPNFGLTPVTNANNYLLKNYEQSTDAERFINEQRTNLRKKQRDQVQPKIDRLGDLLKSYAEGRIEMTPDELKQTVQAKADLEAYQDVLSQEAVRLREIVEGIPALYERNGREEQLTPAEQRGKELDKATDRESKRKIAQRVYADNPFALDIINDQEPKTVEEYISQMLPIGKMNWEGFDRGERHINGVQESVFGKNGATRGIGKGYSTNAFNMYLAPEGEGMGFDEMVHYLYEDAPEVDGRKLYDDTQIRDALINMLLTAQKPSDISHLLINNRIDEAEAHIQEQERLDQEAEEDAKYQELQEWADAHHLTPEEVETYKDYLEEKPWEFEDDIINQIIADDEQNRQSKEMDRQHPDRPAGSESEGGEDQVQVSGSAEGAVENTPVEGQPGAESGAGSPTVPDNDVSGGEQGGEVGQDFFARLAKAKAETDTNPTEAQKKAGNYKMGHIKFGGYQMSIENPKGSTRSGVDRNRKPWSIEMQDTYGYIGKKYGTDGDHLDFFINDDADLDKFEGRVFVVDQKNEDGSFDEHKVMYGYPTWSAARKAYERNYEDGWWDKHVMQMTGVKKAEFDKWLADSDHKTKPFAEYSRTKEAETVNNPVDQVLSDIEDRNEAAARRQAETDERQRIIESLKQPTTGENAVEHLTDAYRLGDPEAIRNVVDAIREMVRNDEDIYLSDDLDPDAAEDYNGTDPERLAEKYIVRLSRHYFVDYDDDIPYIVTGIESPEGRAKVPEPIRYEVEAFLVNDHKIGTGELHGNDLHKAMRNQNDMAAKIQPLLTKLSDEQLDQTIKALEDFPDSAPVIAVQMEQEKRAEKKDAIDQVMAEVEKRKQANIAPVQPTISETDMQYMDDDQLMQRRHKAKSTLLINADLMATNNRIKPGGPKYEQLMKNVMQAEADVAAIDEELEKRANFDQYDFQIENGGQNGIHNGTIAHKLATDAVVKVVGDTGVPITEVSQKEADQMMQLFTTMNQQAIAEYARAMRPHPMKRYAVINVRDPYAVPKYFEKKRFADEYKEWANRAKGLYQTIDLSKSDAKDTLKKAADIQPMIEAWHGSGAVFTKFDHSHVGEGAGSQAFGYGTYLSDNKSIGEDYSNLTTEGWTYKGEPRSAFKVILNGSPNKKDSIRDILSMLNHGKSFEESVDAARNFTQSAIRDYEENKDDLTEADKNDLEVYKAELELINSLKPSDFAKPNKNLYKVEIPDDNGSNYIDWEEEIPAELAEEIRNRIFEFVTADPEFGWNTTQDRVRLKTELKNAIIGKDEDGFYEFPFSKIYAAMSYYLGNSWAGARNIGAKRASDMLADLGYVGIKYPAGTIMGNGRGATNYVIFDEDDAKIVDHIQFEQDSQGKIYGWTDGKGIFLTPLGMNPNSPMHEYTHIWDLYIQKNDPDLWKEMVKTFKKTAAWKELRENPNYRSIWEDDNRMASEVHSRLTGALSEEEFEKAAANPNNKDAADIIRQVKDVLRRFWEKLAQLFKFGGDRLEEFVLMPLRDALKGFNPIMGDYSLDPRAMVGYHGSAAKFDRFDHSKVGSGEGQAVSGYGTYVTTSEGTARYYAKVASDRRRKVIQEMGYTIEGKIVHDPALARAYEYLKKADGNIDEAIKACEHTIEVLNRHKDKNPFAALRKNGKSTAEEAMDYLLTEQKKPGTIGFQDEIVKQPAKQLYEVDIPDDNGKNYLDLDKKLTKTQKIKFHKAFLDALDKSDEADYWKKNRDIIEYDWKQVDSSEGTGDTARAVMEQFLDPEKVSKLFSDMGYVGSKTKGSDGTTYIIFNDNDLKINNRVQFQIEQPMAGEKGVKSLMEGNLFSDADFLPQPTKAEKEISELSDEDLLDAIDMTDGKERRRYIDEYDKRHDEERIAESGNYYNMLEASNTTLDQALDMYDNVFRRFRTGGYSTPERTKMLGQIDALESYIEELKEAEAERQMEDEEEAAVTQQHTQPEPTEAEQKYEEQKKEMKKLGYDLTQLKLRPLEPGETCHVERRYVENGMFSFTGKERIESLDDVAYIFKELENAAVENSFLVFEKDGVPTIIHLAIGLYTATYALPDPALAAYNELDPEKVYFVHNHPSGNLKCSNADMDIMRAMRKIFGDKLHDGIIIDTKSGKYGLYNEKTPTYNGKMPESQENAVPMQVYSFSKQVFDADWNPETAFDGSFPYKIAQFVSSHRLGDHKKMSLIVMSNNYKVTGNVFLPYTNLNQAATTEGADLIARYMNQMGGTVVALYGNYDYDDKDRSRIRYLQDRLKDRSVYLLDVIHLDHSAKESGIVGEPEPTKSKAGESNQTKIINLNPDKNIEDVIPQNPNIKEALAIQDRVKTMTGEEVIEAYNRLNGQMLEEGGLNVDEHEEKIRQEHIAKHGIKGLGQVSADHFKYLIDKYGYGKLQLRWDLLDRIEELGLTDYINGDKKKPEQGARIIKMYRRSTPQIEKLNHDYNVNLTKLANGKLDKGFVFEMGMPSVSLLTTGFPNLPIRMQASVLKTKTHDPAHPFSYSEVYDLVKHIQKPLAIFEYGDKDKAQNLMIGISQDVEDGKQFLVGLALEPVVKGVKLPYNSVRNVFPKNFHDWIHWIAQGKLLRVDGKKEIQDIIDALRINPVDYIDKNVLNSAAKIVKDFKNPTISEENLRNIYGNFVETAEETADLLGGTKVVFESEASEEGTFGWYDPNDNSVHIVLPEHADANDIKHTVFHEKLGHEGLVALLGSQQEVNKFGNFVFGSATGEIRKRIIQKAEDEGYGWDDHLRFSKAAQEVIADIAENGPRTADEFSLWRKIKHYLIQFLNKLGLKVRGLLNDHDLAYYILKTGEALKKWNQMSEEDKATVAQQHTQHDIMRSRRGKPRKRNNESMAQYLQRLREWEMWKMAEEQAAANNDPMPDADKINEKWHEQFNRDMDEWRRANNIPEGESLGEFPKRRQDETPQEYATRVADYETEADAWKNAPSLFDYLQRANDEYRQAYADWKMRYGIREAENVDLGLYEGDPDKLPHIVDPEDLEADNRADAELAEAVGVDMSTEGARRHTKLSVIERRKNLESANAEDAIWIHNMVNSINMEAHRQGVEPKVLREAMADIIEGTYFEEVLKDDEGNVIAVNDISDQLPIKMTTGLRDILAAIKDWYDYFYHEIEDAGLRNDAGYVEEGYVNHVWSREKSNPEAWKKYIDNFQRTKSPNMRERLFKTYREGEDVGLVRKYADIADIMAHYSSSNNQAIANKKFLDDLSFIVVEELNSDGEVVSVLPLLNSQKPNIAVSDRYSMYQVPGVGDVYVLKDVQRTFANIFGSMRTADIPEWLTEVGKVYDVTSSTAKKIQLSFSAFHMGALTEVAMAQMRPDRALKALFQYIIFDCAKSGTIPAYTHPEDFKFAASHLVQLGATQDYSAADVNNVTEKLRNIVRELANSEQVAEKGVGYAATPVAAALDYINKGMDKILWNYLHDGFKLACFKMFAEQIEKRVEKQGLSAEQREQLLDEAGQYVNDSFGGQYWELLNVSPALIKWLRRAFLSPDWLISTQRHFLANFGFGSLYNESGFLNYIQYNVDNLKRGAGMVGKAIGIDNTWANIDTDENRRFRSRNAKICYLIGVLVYFYIMVNAINEFFRSLDVEKEKEKADEIRKTNPDYKSPYELAYPDGMKWYDYTMYGNTIGQQTHLFLGRYNDGTEWYARWGKQFREFPELFMGRHGVEFPTPLMERMSGKANPIGRYLLYDLPLTVGMYGYKQPRETQEIAEKYGNTVALLAMTAKKFLPFSVPTQEDKEFKMFDLVMPSQKGFTRWKAVDYFKTYVQAGDMDGIQRTYNASVMNGVDAEDCLKAAISTVKATQKKQLQDGIIDLQTAMQRFDEAKGAAERKLMKRRIIEYLAEQNYKTFTRDEAMEQVNSFLNGTAEADNDINKYVELQTSGDVRDDYRLSLVRKQAKKFVDEVKTAEGERQKKLADTYQPWIQIDAVIKSANSQISKLKKQLGKGGDDAAIMKQIRDIRSKAQKQVDDIKAP